MSHKKYRSEKDCLNCGAEVTGKFCSNCGQENIETKEKFLPMVGHFISDYLHFDSKFFRSLFSLFTRPGFLTKQYWDGKRVSYIHPLRLFFFVTIIFVVCASVFYKKYGGELRKEFRMNQELVRFDSTYNDVPDTTRFFLGEKIGTLTLKEIRKKRADDLRMIKKLGSGLDDVFKSLKYVAFLLLPVYALVFKLLYIRRRSFYVDHLVYTMHMQVFAYTVLSVAFLLPLWIDIPLTLITRIGMGFIFVYLLISLRYLYQQPWWKTALKALISIIAIFLLTAWIMLMIALFDAIYFK